jgi:hypothetical protein
MTVEGSGCYFWWVFPVFGRRLREWVSRAIWRFLQNRDFCHFGFAILAKSRKSDPRSKNVHHMTTTISQKSVILILRVLKIPILAFWGPKLAIFGFLRPFLDRFWPFLGPSEAFLRLLAQIWPEMPTDPSVLEWHFQDQSLWIITFEGQN